MRNRGCAIRRRYLLHQALVEEGGDPFQDGQRRFVVRLSICPFVRLSVYVLGGLQGEAPGEDGEAAEQGLVFGGEEVVAPGDGVS